MQAPSTVEWLAYDWSRPRLPREAPRRPCPVWDFRSPSHLLANHEKPRLNDYVRNQKGLRQRFTVHRVHNYDHQLSAKAIPSQVGDTQVVHRLREPVLESPNFALSHLFLFLEKWLQLVICANGDHGFSLVKLSTSFLTAIPVD